MIVVIDKREKRPFTFQQFNNKPIIDYEILNTGDYTIRGLETHFAIEYKSHQDFLNCLTDDYTRFQTQVLRLQQIPHSYIIVEGEKIDFDAVCKENSTIKERYYYLTLFQKAAIHWTENPEKKIWVLMSTYYNAGLEAYKNGLLPEVFRRVYEWRQQKKTE